MAKTLLFLTLFAFASAGRLQTKSFLNILANKSIPDGKIVGGYNTTIDRFPYQASLRSRGSHFCGGTIHSAWIIITAAHCFDEGPSMALGVVVGSSFRLDGQTGVPIRKYIMHPLFRSEAWYDYDAAIILLEHPLTFSQTVQPISLAPADKETRAGYRAYVSGWGTLNFMGSSPNQLQYVDVVTIDTKKCTEMYAKVGDTVTNRMICAGEELGGKDGCQGDSGGPLVMENKLIGIVSWGEGCAEARFPGVYSNVAVLRDWMDETKADLMKLVG